MWHRWRIPAKHNTSLEVDMPPIASALRETTSLGFGAKDQPEVNDHRNIHVRPAANGRAWPHREEENRSLDYRESVRIYAFVLVKDDPLPNLTVLLESFSKTNDRKPRRKDGKEFSLWRSINENRGYSTSLDANSAESSILLRVIFRMDGRREDRSNTFGYNFDTTTRWSTLLTLSTRR